MFQGRWPNSLALDQKNRLTLPARLREGAQDREGNTEFMAGIMTDPCVYLHTEAQHERFLERLASRLGDTASGRRAKTYILSRFVPVHCDAQGRITLPASVIKESGIERDVWIVAQESRVELWAAERLRALEVEVEAAGIGDILESVFAEEQREQREKRLLGRAGNGATGEGKPSG